jgi:LPS export ABC transporter protein LptC
MMPRLLLLLALVALLAVILGPSDDESALVGATAPSSQNTGYYLRDALVTEYGVDGDVRIEVAARSATEDPTRQTIALESVSVNYFALPGQRWHLTADNGTAEPGMHSVLLEGNVIMTGGKQSLSQPAVVHTERLTLDTAAQRANTEAPVTLAFGVYALKAIGMRADLKAETVRLESGVNGRFTP